MKKFPVMPSVLILFFSACLCGSTSNAQCTAYFQSLYNSTTGDVDFSQLCTYDTSLHPVVFMWDFGDGGTSTAMSPSHHYTASNNYLVCLILYAGNGPGCCQDTFCELVDFHITAIQKNPEWVSDFSVTAVAKNVTMHLNLGQTQPLRISLVTTTGIIIPVNVARPISQGRNEIDFAMPDYPAGIYLLRMEDQSGHSIARRFMLY